jgi:carbonic anhydrase
VNEFESEYATEQLGSDEKFFAAQFHFHAASEHTINGKRYDFEMHTVHLPKPEEGETRPWPEYAKGTPIPIIASATGLIFDTVDYDPTISPEDRKIIDKFFDSLDFSNLPPTVPGGDSKAKGHSLNANASVPFGDLMRIVNFANRWVYIGSLTTPPCSIGVLHQVVDRVLPISRRHLELYRKHQHQHP